MKRSPPTPARNPGPSWGYRFLCCCDRVLPEWVFRPLRQAGTWIALACMPAQRAASREYLAVVTGRPATLRQVFRHFYAFEESLMLRLRVGCGRPHATVLADDASGYRELMRTRAPALLGTFHLGDSDLAGYLVGRDDRRRVYMVRQRVGNSHDTETLGTRFGDWITFIWVNEAEHLLFALKDAIAAGGSVAMKCDRPDFSAKTADFEFLGAKRRFPFTIYHLSLIFQVPVVLCVGLPDGPGQTVVQSSPLYLPDGRNRPENLARAHAHFQEFLRRVEDIIRADPYLWFNFGPLNPRVNLSITHILFTNRR